MNIAAMPYHTVSTTTPYYRVIINGIYNGIEYQRHRYNMMSL